MIHGNAEHSLIKRRHAVDCVAHLGLFQAVFAHNGLNARTCVGALDNLHPHVVENDDVFVGGHFADGQNFVAVDSYVFAEP